MLLLLQLINLLAYLTDLGAQILELGLGGYVKAAHQFVNPLVDLLLGLLSIFLAPGPNITDQLAALLLGQLATLDQLLDQILEGLHRQRHRADARQTHLADRIE